MKIAHTMRMLLFAFLLVPLFESLHGLIKDAAHLGLIVDGLLSARPKIHRTECLHLFVVNQMRLFDLVLETVEVLRIRQRLGGRVLVVRA